MNSFNEDVLILLKMIKYQYESLFFVKKAEDDEHYPHNRVRIFEEDIRSKGVDFLSINILHRVIDEYLEVPNEEIIKWYDVWDIDGEAQTCKSEIIPNNYLVFTVSTKLDEKIKFLEENQNTATRFDEDKSALIIRGTPFAVTRRGGGGHAHDIFKYIFDHDPKEEHYYYDMEKAGIFGDEKTGSSYYKALTFIQDKLKEELNIDDFFDKISSTIKGSTKINKKYL